MVADGGVLQVVVPGFDFADHGFLDREALKGLVTEQQAKELQWLVRKGGE